MAAHVTAFVYHLYVEGVGDFKQGEFKPDQQLLFDQLPQNKGDITYIQQWPVYIINVGQYTRGYTTYYIQYNPQSGMVRRLIKYYEGQGPNLEDLPNTVYQNILAMIKSGDLVKVYEYRQAAEQLIAKYLP